MKILGPDPVIDGMKKFIGKVAEMYSEENK